MRIFFRVLVLTIFVAISACSNKQIFTATTKPNANDCARLPQSQFDECMEKGMTFEEYQRMREEILAETEPRDKPD